MRNLIRWLDLTAGLHSGLSTHLSFLSSAFLMRKVSTSCWSCSPCCSSMVANCWVKSETVGDGTSADAASYRHRGIGKSKKDRKENVSNAVGPETIETIRVAAAGERQREKAERRPRRWSACSCSCSCFPGVRCVYNRAKGSSRAAPFVSLSLSLL